MKFYTILISLLLPYHALAQTTNELEWQSIAASFAMISMVLLLNLCFFGLLFLLSARNLQEKNKALELQAQEALFDPLTQVYNRRGFERRISQNCAQTGFLLIIDIDNFKLINDRHGHPAGDFVLSEVARLLQQELREQDILSRFGGEEFVLFSQFASYQDAQKLAQRLLKKVELSTFSFEQKLDLNVTVSIGATYMNLASSTFGRCYQAADNNLYQAKHRGKNQAVIACQ